jgi:hypothetical protein
MKITKVKDLRLIVIVLPTPWHKLIEPRTALGTNRAYNGGRISSHVIE